MALLRQMDGLPMPRIELTQSSDGKTVPDKMDRPVVQDLLDWLWQTFGFQVPTKWIPKRFHFLDCAVLPYQIQILHVWLEIQVFLYLLNIKKEMEITYINLQQILGWISDFVRSFFAGAFFKRKNAYGFYSAVHLSNKHLGKNKFIMSCSVLLL